MPATGAGALRSLADDLRARSAAEIAALLMARPDLIDAGVADFRQLSAVASDALSVSRALDDLTQQQLALVEVMAALDDPFTTEDAFNASQLPKAPEDVELLWRRGLLWGTPESMHLVRSAREAFGPYPCGLAPSLAANKPVLARWRQAPEHVLEAVAQLPAPAREIVERLTWSGPQMMYENAGGAPDPEHPRDEVELLLSLGLLIPLDRTQVLIPREVALPMRRGRWLADAATGIADATGIDMPSRNPAVDAIANVDSTAALAGYSCVRAMARLLALVDAQPIRVSKGRTVARSDALALADALQCSQPHVDTLIAIGVTAELLACPPGQPELLGVSQMYDSWCEESLEQQWIALAAPWLDRPGHAALTVRSRVVDLDRHLLRDISNAEVLIQAANVESCELPVGTAIAASSLDSWLAALRPRLTDNSIDCYHAWMSGAELLGCAVHGALSQASRRLMAGDNSVAGVKFLESQPPSIDYCLVQPDNTIVVPGRPSRQLLQVLERFGEVESEDSALVIRVTAQSINRALQAGRGTAEFESFLGEHSRTSVGQALQYLLADQQRRFGALRATSTATVISSQSPADISAILADPRCSELKFQRISDTVISTHADTDYAVQVLGSAGWAPLIELSGTSVAQQQPRPRGAKRFGGLRKSRVERAQALAAVLSRTTTLTGHGTDARRETSPLEGGVPDRLNIAQQRGQQVSLVRVNKGGDMQRLTGIVIHVADGFVTFFDHESQQVTNLPITSISSID